MLDAALAAEVEADGAAADIDMTVAQGGEAVGAVLLGVAGVADADQGFVQKVDHGGQDFLAAVFGFGEVLLQGFAQGGQGFAEREQAAVLVLVADLAPAWVIAVLLAAPGVAAGGLEMAVGVGADPDAGVGRGDGQGVDALDFVGVADAVALWVEVGEFATELAAGEAGGGVVDVVEAGGEDWGFAHGGARLGLPVCYWFSRALGHKVPDSLQCKIIPDPDICLTDIWIWNNFASMR